MEIIRYIKKTMKAIIKWSVSDPDRNANKYTEDCASPVSMNSSRGANGLSDRENAMNFTIYSATGGKVIQFNSYDARLDRHNNHLYIITDKEDLGEELAQIITKESLAR
jgi:hypothetical protein